MPNILEGSSTAAEGRFAIVVARFNETITRRLLDGAVQTLIGHGIPDARVDVAWVPGGYEIPTVAMRLARSGRYSSVICLGAVIRGETTHDQHINRAVGNALARIGMETGVPTLFGVLTCDTLEQAIARSGGDTTSGKDVARKVIGNKGVDCALAALEMVNLLAQLPK
ncbi:MAG: 6,7-dimethyl-8-ribityllumazine synthase [Patescibacteria group bacterium]|nr:6,7-dimethyl-8-ribityllumazine synthase [Patescibacteria group bacterium]